MKLKILGSGTCACALPGIDDRFPPAFLIEFAGERILFDCGEAARFRLPKFYEIEHIAISHSHPDHIVLPQFHQSVLCTRQWLGLDIPSHAINIYCPQHIADNYESLKYFFSPGQKDQAISRPKLEFHAMSDDETHAVGDAKLSAKKVFHAFGEMDALAFRLETADGIFAYSGDTGLCDGVKEAAFEADIFVCEASARIGDEEAAFRYGHLNPFQAGQIAKEGKVKKLVLFHYTGLDSDAALAEDCKRGGFEGETIIGKDFQEISV